MPARAWVVRPSGRSWPRPLRGGRSGGSDRHPSLVGGRSHDDLPFVLRVWNTSGVATVGGPRSEDHIRERIEGWVRQRATHGPGLGATLFEDRTAGDPVGWGGLQHSTIGIGHRLTVGYVITPELWGRRYATEITVASVAYAFDVLEAEELFASILSTNTESRVWPRRRACPHARSTTAARRGDL